MERRTKNQRAARRRSEYSLRNEHGRFCGKESALAPAETSEEELCVTSVVWKVIEEEDFFINDDEVSRDDISPFLVWNSDASTEVLVPGESERNQRRKRQIQKEATSVSKKCRKITDFFGNNSLDYDSISNETVDTDDDSMDIMSFYLKWKLSRAQWCI